MPEVLAEVTGLSVDYPAPGAGLWRRAPKARAVDNVSFSILPGESFGLVGESGSGKSTIGRALVRLIAPAAGRIVINGIDIVSARGAQLPSIRRTTQIIFQDPYASLNPRHRIRDIVRAPLDIHEVGSVRSRHERVAELLHSVGLRPEHADAFPHQFSGGQRQRIGIARALALEPKLLVCDEPVSALDVSVQAQMLNLLMKLQRERGLAYLFISHDLSVIRHMCRRVAVLKSGNIVETGQTEQIFAAPEHGYTRRLVASIPVSHPRERRQAISAAEDPLDERSRASPHPD